MGFSEVPRARIAGAGAVRLFGRNAAGRTTWLARDITFLGRVEGRTVGRGFGAIFCARERDALRRTLRALARCALAPRRTEVGCVRRVGTLVRRVDERVARFGVRRTPVLRVFLNFLGGISIYLLRDIFHYQTIGKSSFSITKHGKIFDFS